MAPGGVPYIPDLDAFRAQMQTSGPRLLAIDFTATWCGPCQMIGPHFEAMRPEFPFVDFCKVDVDDNQETAAQCGIRSMPTFKFYRMGSQVAEFTGADVNRLRAVLTEHGGPPTGLAPNTEVVLFALKSKPELNDRKGVVKSFDSSKGRYAVEIDSETLALKRDNLCAACKNVELSAADDGTVLPEGCPTSGTIVGYLPDAHIYRIESGGEMYEVPAGCAKLADGSAAVIVGLTGAAEHNGKEAHVLGLHAESGRVEVALSAVKTLRLKRANLRA